MNLVRLQDHTDKVFEMAMQLYQQSFPVYEQRLLQDQKAVLAHAEYHFDLLYDQHEFIGLLMYWETDKFIYVEHFCTAVELRGRGYGIQALQLLAHPYKPVILEIDPPIDDISIRRKAFYERAGYRANGFYHVHPPYRADYTGHELVVMSSPHLLSEECYHEFFEHLQNTVMYYAQR